MAACGLLLGLSAPGYGLWMLAWLALIPALLWVRQQNRLKVVFLGGFLLGFGYHGLVCLWFFDLHPVTWLGFNTLESLLITLAGWLMIALEGGLLGGMLLVAYRKLTLPWLRVLLFPLIWVFGFSMLHWTPLALPWAMLEYTQAGLWPVRLLASWIGASGIAGLLVLHNSYWAETFSGDKGSSPEPSALRKGRFRWKPIMPLLIPVVIGLFALFLPPPATNQRWPIPVTIIQANLPIEIIRSSALNRKKIEASYIAPLQRLALIPGTLVLYPEEGVVSGWVSVASPHDNAELRTLSGIAKEKNIYIALGVSTYDGLARHYNSIALLSPDSETIQFYHKRRLVPFGEYTPYGLEHSLTSFLSSLNIDYSTPYQPGSEDNILDAGPVKLAGLVCFELIDAHPLTGGYASESRKDGAHMLINTSNLGWFHQNPLLEAQFLAIGQMRAAETGLPLAIASNTGISAVISSQGAVLRKTTPNSDKPGQSQVISYEGRVEIGTRSRLHSR